MGTQAKYPTTHKLVKPTLNTKRRLYVYNLHLRLQVIWQTNFFD